MGYHGIASDRPEVEQVSYGSEAPMGFAVSRCEEVRGDPGRLWMTLKKWYPLIAKGRTLKGTYFFCVRNCRFPVCPCLSLKPIETPRSSERNALAQVRWNCSDRMVVFDKLLLLMWDFLTSLRYEWYEWYEWYEIHLKIFEHEEALPLQVSDMIGCKTVKFSSCAQVVENQERIRSGRSSLLDWWMSAWGLKRLWPHFAHSHHCLMGSSVASESCIRIAKNFASRRQLLIFQGSKWNKRIWSLTWQRHGTFQDWRTFLPTFLT